MKYNDEMSGKIVISCSEMQKRRKKNQNENGIIKTMMMSSVLMQNVSTMKRIAKGTYIFMQCKIKKNEGKGR